MKNDSLIANKEEEKERPALRKYQSINNELE